MFSCVLSLALDSPDLLYLALNSPPDLIDQAADAADSIAGATQHLRAKCICTDARFAVDSFSEASAIDGVPSRWGDANDAAAAG